GAGGRSGAARLRWRWAKVRAWLSSFVPSPTFPAACPRPTSTNSQIGQQPYSVLVHSIAPARRLGFGPLLRVCSRRGGVLHRAVPSAAVSRRRRQSDRFLPQIEKTQGRAPMITSSSALLVAP